MTTRTFPCPQDTNDDGDCGQPGCPWCSPLTQPNLRTDLLVLANGDWSERTDAADRIATRIEQVEARQRGAAMVTPGCPCGRLRPCGGPHDCAAM